jgi:formylglycine-generating enzyme required for sulfatase activity
MKIQFYFSDKMKRRQTPIYSALIDLGIPDPKPEGISVPLLVEPIFGRRISPGSQDGAGNTPVAPGSRPDAVIAASAPEVSPSEAEVPAPAFPAASPVIRLSRLSHDFGAVLEGDCEDWVLTFYNEGEIEGIISSLSGLPLGGFSLVEPPPLPFIIPPHGSRVITVRFVPELAGRKWLAQLSITTSDHGCPILKVLLTGTGLTAQQKLNDRCPPAMSNSLGMSFGYVPAGTFIMGSPEHEPGRNDDEVPHEVTLTTDFYLQTTPVTQGQWQALMGNNPSGFENCGLDCPVEQVSWHECQEFFNRLNAMEEGAYRLPTEAEWEYAARAGSNTAFARGGITALFCDHDPTLDSLGWYCGNSDRQTHPVAQKVPNARGLYDMHGNVYEWCQDWYGEYPPTPLTDPGGPASGTGRVGRGGSWFSSAKTCRSASRLRMSPDSKTPFLGFRVLKGV